MIVRTYIIRLKNVNFNMPYTSGADLWMLKFTCRSFYDVTPGGYQVVVARGTAAVEFLRYSEKGSAMREV